MKKIRYGMILLLVFILGGTTIYGVTTLYEASEVGYDNSSSGTSNTDVQGAVDELYELSEGCEETLEDKRFYLYQDGEEYQEITGGWTSSGYGGYYTTAGEDYTLKSVVKNSDHLLLQTTVPAQAVVVGTEKLIDISGYSYLGVEVETSGQGPAAILANNKYLNPRMKETFFAATSKLIVFFPLSDLTESSIYISFILRYAALVNGGIPGTTKIYKVWLEK